MKVKDLISFLSSYPEDTEVFVYYDDWCLQEPDFILESKYSIPDDAFECISDLSDSDSDMVLIHHA